MGLAKFKDDLLFSLYVWKTIPLIGFCSPKLLESEGKRTVLKIPLVWRTRNHLKAMYFGALCIGAELCIALLAVKKINEQRAKGGAHIDFIFKDFKAEFLKRAEGDVHFICEEADVILEEIAKAQNTDERLNRTMTAYAVVPSIDPNEKIGTFTLTMSIKRRTKRS